MYVNKKKIQLSTRFKLIIYTHYYNDIFHFKIYQNNFFFIFKKLFLRLMYQNDPKYKKINFFKFKFIRNTN
jgi:hypothetical protein